MAREAGPVVGITGSRLAAERLAGRAEGRTQVQTVRTPYGSVDVVTGTIGGARFAAAAKSQAAEFPTHNQPVRATLHALSKLGCDRVLSTSAATSLDAELRIADCFVPDDFIDLTGRSVTFFDGGPEGTHHADMDAPFCGRLSREFVSVARSFALRVKAGGTVATLPGPQHPSPSEAARLSQMGALAASFSAATEAKLARELGVCFVTAAVLVRQALPRPEWREGRAWPERPGQSDESDPSDRSDQSNRSDRPGQLEPSEAEVLRALARGEEAPASAPRAARASAPGRAPGRSLGRSLGPPPSGPRRPARPRAKEERELEGLKAKLKEADAQLEEAAAAFIPQAGALAPCPYCPRGAGPRRN